MRPVGFDFARDGLSGVNGVRRWLGDGLFRAALGPVADLSQPAGDPGLYGPGSMAWRVHANPVTLAVGGIAAVILELAEPRVREGVWAHSSFRTDPLRRMRHTAVAAMITTYGSTALAREGIARVGRMHGPVRGTTPQGEAYDARDPALCEWVHVTAGFGFLEAYRRLIAPDLSTADQDRYWAQGEPIGKAFGAGQPPRSAGEARAMIEAMRPRLARDPILDDFLRIAARASPLGAAGRPLQPVLVEAAIGILPAWARTLLAEDRPIRQSAALAMLVPLARAAPLSPMIRTAYARVGATPPQG